MKTIDYRELNGRGYILYYTVYGNIVKYQDASEDDKIIARFLVDRNDYTKHELTLLAACAEKLIK